MPTRKQLSKIRRESESFWREPSKEGDSKNQHGTEKIIGRLQWDEERGDLKVIIPKA